MLRPEDRNYQTYCLRPPTSPTGASPTSRFARRMRSRKELPFSLDRRHLATFEVERARTGTGIQQPGAPNLGSRLRHRCSSAFAVVALSDPGSV